MGSRIPSVSLPNQNDPVKAKDVSAFLEWLRGREALDYVDIEVEFTATATGSFDHGLGRAYRGATVLWVSDVTVGLNALNPMSATDPVTLVELGTVGGGVFTGTALVRVY